MSIEKVNLADELKRKCLISCVIIILEHEYIARGFKLTSTSMSFFTVSQEEPRPYRNAT